MDLWNGLGLSFVPVDGTTASEVAARNAAQQMVRETLQKQTATITDPDTGTTRSVTYVLGDSFHSNSLLVEGAADFTKLALDLEGNGNTCDDTTSPNLGYRCFFERHLRRRRVILGSSNDGQVHAFDAGIFQGSVIDQSLQGQYNLGTGKEIFAHVTRPMLQHTADMTSLEHGPGVDGSMRAGDYFIDPEHDGTPAEADREWRTVVITTYREGGAGLVALDLPSLTRSRSRTSSTPPACRTSSSSRTQARTTYPAARV